MGRLARLLTLGVAVLACLLGGAAPVAAGHVRTWLDPPVVGTVTAGFAMTSTYGAGHRGVDLRTDDEHVRASAHGVVTFAGTVVGQRWVTVDHGDVRTTVGSLATIAVGRGAHVVRGQVLGTAGSAHGTDGRVHWSARVGDSYVDPRSAHRLVATLLPGAPGPAVASVTGPVVARGWPWGAAA